jgi:hypothetical protein
VRSVDLGECALLALFAGFANFACIEGSSHPRLNAWTGIICCAYAVNCVVVLGYRGWRFFRKGGAQ